MPDATAAGARRSRVLYLFLAPLILLGATKAKGCNCDGRPDEVPDEVVPVDVVQQVEVALQVVSLEPAVHEANKALEGTLYGAGFKAGATVTVGATPAVNVRLVDENTMTLTVPGLPEGAYDVLVINQDGDRATLRRGLTVRAPRVVDDCSFVRVYFSFDQAALTDESRVALDQKVPCLMQRTSRITVEGHTDERGTISYNMGLGDRRASSVVRHLVGQGVARSRIDPVTYGEERPVAPGATESAWAQNRRVDIHAK